MKLEFAFLEIEDIWEARVNLVAYGVFPNSRAILYHDVTRKHVPRILLFRRMRPICAGTKKCKALWLKEKTMMSSKTYGALQQYWTDYATCRYL
jgi:hypothetical protein